MVSSHQPGVLRTSFLTRGLCAWCVRVARVLWCSAVATDGVRVFSASDDKTVRIWQRGADPAGDPSKHALVQTLAGHSGPVYGVASGNFDIMIGPSVSRTLALHHPAHAV